MENKNSLIQYLQLFDSNRSALEQGVPTFLSEYRTDLAGLLSASRLPEKGDEGYKKTSVNEMFAPDFGVNLYGHNLIADPPLMACGVDTLKSIKVVVHNDVAVRVLLPKGVDSLPDGLQIITTHHGDADGFTLIEGILSKLDLKDDPASALNLLLNNESVIVRVHPGKEIDLPIQIINYTGSPSPLMANRKVFVLMEQGSKAHILSCDHSLSAESMDSMLNNVLTCVSMGEDAFLDFVEIEETNSLNRRYSSFFVNQNKGSQLHIGLATLMNGITRNNYIIKADGDKTVTTIDGLAIGINRSHIDNSTTIEHLASHGRSDQMLKYALFDYSSGSFEGRILVDHNARFNEAHQNNRNIIESLNARMNSEPQLLIYNDDVKCSHGATTGQLDENAVYYMRTRGIPLNEARAMLMQAFMNDVIDRLQFPGLQDWLRRLVERRLRGEDLLCSNCRTLSRQ